MRKFFAILSARLIKAIIKITRRGTGSALPGLVAQKIEPHLFAKLAAMLPQGVILVTGTNGKTTTAKIIASILKKAGLKVVYNFNGSNLSRGLTSTLIEHTNFWGNTIDGDIGLFEVDEATMPEVLGKLSPKIIVVTNIFRDQLDRYGEVDRVASIIGDALKAHAQAKIILNADDPLVASLCEYNPNVFYFGIDTDYKTISRGPLDSHHCRRCQTELIYSNQYFSHLGQYHCPTCGLTRPKLDYALTHVAVTNTHSSANLNLPTSNQAITINLPGFYNLYNTLAAASVADYLHIAAETIIQTLGSISPAFGRMEKIALPDNKSIVLILVKNPTSFIQSLETLTLDQSRKNLLLILNDHLADGTDISWIWDVDFSSVHDIIDTITVSGTRAEDMELRLKYAGYIKTNISKENSIAQALDKAIKNLAPEEILYVFPTYTAMLQVRHVLAQKSYVKGLME